MSFPGTLPLFPRSNEIQQQEGNPILAPLWASADGRFSRVHYQVHSDSATLANITSMLAGRPVAEGFQPEYALKVTWSAVRAFPASQFRVESRQEDTGVSVLLRPWFCFVLKFGFVSK